MGADDRIRTSATPRLVTQADYPHFSARLAARLQELQARQREVLQSEPELSARPDAIHDTKDDAFVDRQREVSRAELLREAAEIVDIEYAQRSIQEQLYGQCLDCGNALTWQRLEAYPTARRCLSCQAAREGHQD